MIPRYSRPEMTTLWNAQTKYAIWFEIEAYAALAMAQEGIIPEQDAKAIADWIGRIDFDSEKIDAIEAEVKHDVIAFLTYASSIIGKPARFLHQGLTSSDILDTALNVQLMRASDILLHDIDALLSSLKRRAYEHKQTLCIGRSHGIHAEPTTFGLKLAGYYAEFARNRTRLEQARQEIAVCSLSGAVGTFAHLPPSIETYVAQKMGLQIEPLATQVIPRDRHANFFAVLGIIASSIERLAVEIRHLQRTEVREVEEYFSPGQKGSSAMPHKRNPILTENLTGLARIVRSSVIPAMENVALWHERDISHSSVERMIAPDATITLDFALTRLTNVIDKLVIYPEKMQHNFDLMGGLVYSQRLMLALTQAGMSREDAYRLIQKQAMRVWQEGGQLADYSTQDSEITTHLSAEAIQACCQPTDYLQHINTIFDRVFGEG